MKRPIILLFLLLIVKPLCGQGDWDLRKDKNGIVVHTRTPEGSNLKEYKCSATINAPIERIYAFLVDLEARPGWVINCQSVTIIDTVQGIIRYHTSYEIPWPMSDRDLVVEADNKIDPEAGKARLHTVNSDLAYPIEKDFVRIEKYRESATLVSASSNSTIYRVEGFADPGGKMPAWIINMFLDDGIYDSVMEIKSATEN